jgi:hypothetical protein
MYVATTKAEGNAADGRFSTACQEASKVSIGADDVSYMEVDCFPTFICFR